jgi:hypothetical protein
MESRFMHFKLVWTRQDVGNVSFSTLDNGIADLTNRSLPACHAQLPYPVSSSGLFRVKCERCGSYGIVAARGSTSDPRTVKLPCRREKSYNTKD